MYKKANGNQRFPGHFFPRGKKGIELSINFLVIIIISLVMLSLGIYLIRQFFVTTEEMRITIDTQTEAQISTLLEHGELVALPINKKTIPSAKQAIFGLGILNIGESAEFKVEIEFKEGYTKTGDLIPGVNGTEWLFYSTELFHLAPNERKSDFPILVRVPATPKGTYIFNINVTANDKQYGIHKMYVEVP